MRSVNHTWRYEVHVFDNMILWYGMVRCGTICCGVFVFAWMWKQTNKSRYKMISYHQAYTYCINNTHSSSFLIPMPHPIPSHPILSSTIHTWTMHTSILPKMLNLWKRNKNTKTNCIVPKTGRTIWNVSRKKNSSTTNVENYRENTFNVEWILNWWPRKIWMRYVNVNVYSCVNVIDGAVWYDRYCTVQTVIHMHFEGYCTKPDILVSSTLFFPWMNE